MISRHFLSRVPRKHHACPCRLAGTGDSLLLWALRTYRTRRRQYPLFFRQPEHAHLVVVRLRSPGAARDWLAGITMQAAPASAEQQAPGAKTAVTKG
jgi:hypothetical protein